ncbi:MAG TPA: VOC family protein [Thermoanaerobaculia bacterium]
MPAINAYLIFNGNCAEAMRWYEQVLGGKLQLMTHKDALPPEQIPPGMADRIMHARLEAADGGVLMASDNFEGVQDKMTSFHVSLVYPTADAARRVFDAFAEGGTVLMPFEKTFWADGFGMVTDRYGTPWMVNGGEPHKD